MPNLLSQKITTEFFNHAVARNINIRFILIISVIVVVVPICSLIATIFFLLYLVFLFASFLGVFFFRLQLHSFCLLNAQDMCW